MRALEDALIFAATRRPGQKQYDAQAEVEFL